MICAFIDAEKDGFGVVPVCRALTAHGISIAPRTYWARLAAAPSKRQLWDTAVTEILAGIYEPDADGRRPPECLYGTVKMWVHLRRQGIPVAKWVAPLIRRGFMFKACEVDGAGGVESFLWGADREAGAQDGVLVAVVGGGVDGEAEGVS